MDITTVTCCSLRRLELRYARAQKHHFLSVGTGGNLSLASPLSPLLLSQDRTMEELIAAAKGGDTGTIAKVLDRGVRVDAADVVELVSFEAANYRRATPP